MTPTRAVPSAIAKTAPTVTSEGWAWSMPMRPLTPQREFWARDQHSRVPAVGEPGGLHARVRCRRTDGEAAGQRPYGERGEGDRGERLAVARAEVRNRQIDGARERRHAQQAERGSAVGVPFGGDPGRGDRGGRTRSEAADHRTRDDRGDGVGEGGRAVPENGQREADPGECARADPVDTRGE
jgi:hypothetical protein